MSVKILVADDSLTIQKVVKITLSAENYETNSCLNAKEMFHAISKYGYQLILLDYNLSEEESGDSIFKKIQELSPNARIIIMYSAYDNIDESILNAIGASYKIIKPFDSADLIAICRQAMLAPTLAATLAPDTPLVEEEMLEATQKIIIPATMESTNPSINKACEFQQDQWVMKPITEEIEDAKTRISALQTTSKKLGSTSQHTPQAISKHDIINKEFSSWGIAIPPRMDATAASPLSHQQLDEMEIPPPITDKLADIPNTERTVPCILKPELQQNEMMNDFLWQDNSLPTATTDNILPINPTSQEIPKSKLIPLEELNPPSDIEIELENGHGQSMSKNEPYADNIPLDASDIHRTSSSTKEEFDFDELKEKVEDDFEADDFWDVDVSQGKIKKPEQTATLTNAPSFSEDETKEFSLDYFENADDTSAHPDLSFFNSSQNPPLPPSANNILNITTPRPASFNEQQLHEQLLSEIKKELPNKIRPILEDALRKYCKEIIEKVAWEVIPDLAENLVQKELSKMAEDETPPAVANHTRDFPSPQKK
ncbi:MAG: response regulator transcription factor [Oligoflexia bacterium]|nr:response regulator transcription factor [Oligoflexia bacterium]MBF0364372.1 response regulator transcription factor [Oligoflexia bacterium]